jgi:hypothetical protein
MFEGLVLAPVHHLQRAPSTWDVQLLRYILTDVSEARHVPHVLGSGTGASPSLAACTQLLGCRACPVYTHGRFGGTAPTCSWVWYWRQSITCSVHPAPGMYSLSGRYGRFGGTARSSGSRVWDWRQSVTQLSEHNGVRLMWVAGVGVLMGRNGRAAKEEGQGLGRQSGTTGKHWDP